MSISFRVEPISQRPSAPPAYHPPDQLPPLRYAPPKATLGSRLKRFFGPVVAVCILGLKFFAPLLKILPVLLKTGGSMLLMIGVYAAMYGWQWALGFVLLLLIHECGHLLVARRLGLPVSAPMFIPFMGAVIILKEAPKNAWIEAQVGIGGPLLGSAGAVVCYATYMVTGQPLFAALAFTGFLLNLFNLAPIGFLDGGRIVSALSPWLWLLGTAVMVGLLFLRFNPIVLLILILSLPRLLSLFRRRTEEEKRYFEVTAGQRASIALLYFGLAAALALGMRIIHDSGVAGR